MTNGTRRAAARKAIKARSWRKPPLNVKLILSWADAHYEETGRWPTRKSGRVRGTVEERWDHIDQALRFGSRTLPGGDSLPRLLQRFRSVRNRKALPPYTVKQILGWADAYHQRHGRWPLRNAGAVAEAPGETWTAVEIALSHGNRGLPGGSSLARLLAEHRARRNRGDLPTLKVQKILKWADAHHQHTGMWPTHESGPVADARDETWLAVDKALRNGTRGLRGGTSLARLLHRQRAVPAKHRRRPPLSIEMILAWADAHHKRTGDWPNVRSGVISVAPAETWSKLQLALNRGQRGLNRRSSLAKLFAEHRGVRNIQDLPDFTIKQILTWADAHHERHGRWPSSRGGPIDDAPGETWTAVGLALARGTRGLRGGTSLARLLAERRGVRKLGYLPMFSTARILAWADAHHQRTGMWPTHESGPITEALDETWRAVDKALRNGMRGLRGGDSLARFLKRHRGVMPKHRRKPPLTIEMILKWADLHHRRVGHWPKQSSGKVAEALNESWGIIDTALRKGHRGLPKGLALGKLWARYRGVRNVHSISKLKPEQILKWADAHYRRTGTWPQVRAGIITESPTDNWLKVESALRRGLRGLPGGSSLKRFLDKHRRTDQVTPSARRPSTAMRRPVSTKRRKPR